MLQEWRIQLDVEGVGGSSLMLQEWEDSAWY